jgi:hypothetical protein
MPVINLKTIRPFIWIPPKTQAKYKITITRNDGTIDDVSSIITYYEFSDNVTESVGAFEIRFHNSNNNYTSVYTGNEIVKIYKDYAATVTTLRFRGRVEKPDSKNYEIILKGRSEGYKMMDRYVNKTYTNIETSVIITDLFNTYLPTFTTNNVETSTTNLNITFSNRTLFEAVRDVARAAGFDIYVDKDVDVNYFLKGSRDNTTDAIVHNMNLIKVDDFTPDLTLVKNKIQLYGAIEKGIQILATAEDSTSQTTYGIKEMRINDENITKQDDADDIVAFELANRKDPPQTGAVTGLLLATIQPGERIRISDPDNGITPQFYTTTGYTDIYDMRKGIRTTKVKINKEVRNISHILTSRVENENKKKSTFLNPEDMDNSYNFLFDSDTGTHTNTEIVDGLLRPTAGTGEWISPSKTLTSNITEAYLILNGETLTGATVSISGNNDVSYQTITNRSKITVSSAIGTSLVVKVVFSSADTQITSLSILYKIT